MTLPEELFAAAMVALTLIFSAWVAYEHRRTEAAVKDALFQAGNRSFGFFKEYEARVIPLEARTSALEAQNAGTGGHTHTMSFASQHEEGGKTVLVKACQCGHVIRERQA